MHRQCTFSICIGIKIQPLFDVHMHVLFFMILSIITPAITLFAKESSQKVKLRDDYRYPIKGVGEASYKLESGELLKMKDVLYVPGLKKNLLFISGLEKNGFRVAFMHGQVLMWPRGSTINDAVVIGVEERGLYKIKGSPEQALFHSIIDPCELWNRRFSHLHYWALPSVSKAVLGIPKLKSKHEGVCKGCAQGKNVKKTIPEQ